MQTKIENDEILKYIGKLHLPLQTIFAFANYVRKEIWRNELYPNYKETRDKDDSFMGGPFFKQVYQENNKPEICIGTINIGIKHLGKMNEFHVSIIK